MALRPNAGHGLLILEVSRPHTTTYHSRYSSSGWVISSQRPLPDNTQHSQQKSIHAPGGIRTHDLSRRAVADLRLRPRGHWDRQRTSMQCQYNCRRRFKTTNDWGVSAFQPLLWLRITWWFTLPRDSLCVILNPLAAPLSYSSEIYRALKHGVAHPPPPPMSPPLSILALSLSVFFYLEILVHPQFSFNSSSIRTELNKSWNETHWDEF